MLVRATPSAASSSPVTDQAAVAQAYTDYWVASVRAEKLPASQARVLLAPYLTPEAMAKELAGTARWPGRHIEAWGYVTVHILTIKVNERTAKLTECQDASTAGVADARTHHLISGTKGTSLVPIRAYLRRGDDAAGGSIKRNSWSRGARAPRDDRRADLGSVLVALAPSGVPATPRAGRAGPDRDMAWVG
ncbi:hypothetical protein ACRYCC_32765 [Actinomadura scrupuli]|uniref:hypothetical protein n=1 Tax=Actinomadura scrupuli TaxID=559629 RepID=UPI003D9512C9